MKKIEAIIRPIKLEVVKSALADAGISGLTVSDVRGCGSGLSPSVESYRGEAFVIRMPPKVRLELTVKDDDVDPIIDLLIEHARTGQDGDGKIFVYPIDFCVRIRTGETGESVL